MIEWNRRGTIAAMVALTAALLLFGAALARAVLLRSGPAEPPAQTATESTAAETAPAAPLVPSEATLSAGDIALAVDHDPFQPDRTRAAPYRLPGEDVPAVAAAAELAPAPEFLVTGVVQDGERGIALIQLPDQTSLVIGVGESVLGYRLERVGATSATLVGEGRTLELPLASAAAKTGADNGWNGRDIRTWDDVSRALEMWMGSPTAAANYIRQRQELGFSVADMVPIINRFFPDRGPARGGRGAIVRDTSGVPRGTPESSQPT